MNNINKNKLHFKLLINKFENLYVDMNKHIKICKNNSLFSFEPCTDLLRALSDKTRQQIVLLFGTNKELCVNDIAKEFSLSRPTISHHLSLMKRAKLLKSRKEGKEIFHSLNKEYVSEYLTAVLKSINDCC
jgi:ArsR family transcriptional regulator, arsenate/arsenite/antimonite-responsive transcriptional repressor